MNRIDKKFEQLKKEGKTALIPYLMAGFPTVDTSKKLVVALAEAGADIIEIGIPFSDPLADGATIQRASEVALSNGVTTDDVLSMVSDIRQKTDVPVVLMTYYNVILRYGLTRFAGDAVKAGVDGVILPDLPPEEALDWRRIAKKRGISSIFLVARTSTDERIKKVASASTGFIYCVSLLGVTGARAALSKGMAKFLSRVRSETAKPLAVGFGISNLKQAQEVAKIADGVIIGSALLSKIDQGKSKRQQIDSATRFIKSLKAAI